VRSETVITQHDIDDYARLSNDHNPLHVDVQAAVGGPFGRTIAHGTIAVAILQDLYQGAHAAGRDFVSLSYTFKFLSPLFPDEPVVFEISDVEPGTAECRVRSGERLILVGRIKELESSGV
jgi:3-hydroxybutyryl-CoA dehydratase